MEESSPEPNYQHPCSHCRFLGDAEYEGRLYDLYFCKQGHFIPTVIARGSSNPNDYSSGILLATFDPVLREALERAKERGMVALDYVPEEGDD